MSLPHQDGGEGEEGGQQEGEDDKEGGDPALLSHRDDGSVETIELEIRK